MKTIKEFAKLKNCSRCTIYRAIKRNELDFIKVYEKTLLKNTVKNKNWIPVESKKR